MGYYVNITSAECVIPADKQGAALIEMKRINGPAFDHLKRGGSWSNGGQTAKWYSWMPESFDEFETIEQFLNHVGFDTTIDAEGDLHIDDYDDKTGSEDMFLTYLAPYIVAGGYIDWRGEDGSIWRNEFDGAVIATKSATITWD